MIIRIWANQNASTNTTPLWRADHLGRHPEPPEQTSVKQWQINQPRYSLIFMSVRWMVVEIWMRRLKWFLFYLTSSIRQHTRDIGIVQVVKVSLILCAFNWNFPTSISCHVECAKSVQKHVFGKIHRTKSAYTHLKRLTTLSSFQSTCTRVILTLDLQNPPKSQPQVLFVCQLSITLVK